MPRLKSPFVKRQKANTIWTIEAVAARFQDAVATAKRLPSANVQGYFNSWPAIVRSQWEVLAADERVICRFPPTPEDIEQMLEVVCWVQWLEVEQRHLVWMRAKRYGWRDICVRFACDRSTAWRRWQRALQMIVDRLNNLTVSDA